MGKNPKVSYFLSHKAVINGHPPPVTTTSNNGAKNTESTQGIVTGNTVSGTDKGTVGGGVTIQLTGTISADGNTVTGTSLCKTNAGPATANGTFTWIRKQAQFTLTRATTTDAESVDVIYKASDANIQSQSIHFDVYRSAAPNLDPGVFNSRKLEVLSQKEIFDETNSDRHLHGVNLTFKNSGSLKPNTAFPYVVVVATYNGKQSTTYFQKWMLGAISHGFSRYDYFTLTWLARYAVGKASEHLVIPDWEILMAEKLKSVDKYDDVIEFKWTETSGTAQPGLAKDAGNRLRTQIVDWISTHTNHHPGDVVDIHLIGHSRGTVVVSQTLNGIMPYLREMHLGSYIELTLLDPHPANNRHLQ